MERTDDESRATREKNLSRTERVASLAGGGALVLWGFSELPLTGLAGWGLGSYLLYRGATGYCPVYGRLGISSRDPRPMLIEAEAATTISRAVEDVFAWYSRPTNLADASRFLAEAVPNGADVFRFRLAFPGRRSLQIDAKKTERSPESIAWRSTPPLDYGTETSFSRLHDDLATRVRTVATWRPAVRVRGLVTKALELAGGAVLGLVTKSEQLRAKERIEDAEAARSEAAEQPAPSLH